MTKSSESLYTFMLQQISTVNRFIILAHILKL